MVVFSFKGYRDAECGWLPVQEETHDVGKTNSNSAEQPKRTALFLIIHAPRRGILEASNFLNNICLLVQYDWLTSVLRNSMVHAEKAREFFKYVNITKYLKKAY